MTKKKKAVIFSIIIAICAAIIFIILWLFVFKSIKGEWYVDDPYAFFNEQVEQGKMTEEEQQRYKTIYEDQAPKKYVFNSNSFDTYSISGKNLGSLYYKIEDGKLYYSKDENSFPSNSYYTIAKQTSDELILQQRSSKDIVLKRK